MKLLAWGMTDVGQKRDHNEDSFLIRADLGLFAVADGMGGHQGGDRASRLAVEILEREIRRAKLDSIRRKPGEEAPPSRALRRAARTASRTIFNLAQRDPHLTGMGTTLTAILFSNGHAHLVHVGDSRAYLFRDERLEQISEDHSWIEEQVRSGFMTVEEAQESSLKHIITRSVGFEPDVQVDQLTIPMLMGDCFLLCSDGLSNHIQEDSLRKYVSEGYYSEVPRRLVDQANDCGGDDNITTLLVYVANDSSESPAEDLGDILDAGATEELEFDPYAQTMAPEDE